MWSVEPYLYNLDLLITRNKRPLEVRWSQNLKASRAHKHSMILGDQRIYVVSDGEDCVIILESENKDSR
ncbi:hypothetical protein J6590_001500 [Homalodisca vitripennis]|nr:hypothetical protein J6590_001500 [Homalodisca vitripennis]